MSELPNSRDRGSQSGEDDERKEEEAERNWGFIIILVGEAATDSESQLTRRVKVPSRGGLRQARDEADAKIRLMRALAKI